MGIVLGRDFRPLAALGVTEGAQGETERGAQGEWGMGMTLGRGFEGAFGESEKALGTGPRLFLSETGCPIMLSRALLARGP